MLKYPVNLIDCAVTGRHSLSMKTKLFTALQKKNCIQTLVPVLVGDES